MTEPLAKPPKKDPVARTRQPTLPPGLRSRAGLGLTAMAAEGRFALQVCAECGAVQYPPRDVCGTCLSGELPWRDVSPAGHLMVSTTLHHSNDVYFRERLPWRVGTVQMQAGPSVIAHIHADCADNSPVSLALRLDRSGQAVMIALPARSTPNMTDEKTLRETSCDPKFRRVLVTDGKSAIGQAVARAMLDAGSPTVFLGDPQVWRHDAAFAKLAEDPRVQTVPLDVTDTDAVERAAAAIGGKVEILVNTADFEREGGLLGRKDVNIARDALDVNALGLVRLAQAFGGALCGRAADGVNNAAAWVNVLSVYAHMNLPSHGLWSAAKAAALSLAQCLRAEMAGAGVRVINVFPGPVDHEWQQRTPPPRVAPAAIATAIVKALQQGVEDVYVGDIAQEVRARLAENPKGLERELAAPAR
ncbi:SDR family NAD(P)-dependent oxidoreductase [Achromobacter sp. GG226]|uniref:SDR family NAD(P)-dependent oxidoreductase n=1 Tax=Verticiella alkaliphila TaxID=2779529 RepID=UPI001C0AD6E1|nr:SDR family NAD(P)-dependent oxidoreductase [Verticiella sp. GG226]MBU4610905.1 SDR family NAD(P)-dependent oxidoreductase [Verticiella sp. GG226]